MNLFRIFDLVIILSVVRGLEIFDYSNEEYILVPMEQAYLYGNNGTIFHVFNITDLQEKFERFTKLPYSRSKIGSEKIKFLMNKCRNYIDQLIVHRNKRSLDFLGSVIKFVTGMPDRDDMVMVEQKINELIANNEHLAEINLKLKNNVEFLKGINGESYLELLLEWLIKELSDFIYTINLAKMGVLNTAILNLADINQMIGAEKFNGISLMEILEHSTFKILRIKSVYVLMIKYPLLEKKCMLLK